MNDLKASPGPYKVKTNGTLVWIDAADGTMAAIHGLGKNRNIVMANAYLFGSSRELYEALKKAREYIRNAPASYDGVKTLFQVDAALSAARGEESGS